MNTFTATVATATTLEAVHAAEFAYLDTPAGFTSGKLRTRRMAIAALGAEVPARGPRDTDAQYAVKLDRALTAAFTAKAAQ